VKKPGNKKIAIMGVVAAAAICGLVALKRSSPGPSLAAPPVPLTQDNSNVQVISQQGFRIMEMPSGFTPVVLDADSFLQVQLLRSFQNNDDGILRRSRGKIPIRFTEQTATPSTPLNSETPRQRSVDLLDRHYQWLHPNVVP
jgi:hypothetical protein